MSICSYFPTRSCRTGAGRCSRRFSASRLFSAAGHKLGLVRRHSGHCLRCLSQAALAESCSSSKRSRSRIYSESFSRHSRSCAFLCFSAATIADTYLLWSSRPTRHLIAALPRGGAYKSHYRREFKPVFLRHAKSGSRSVTVNKSRYHWYPIRGGAGSNLHGFHQKPSGFLSLDWAEREAA